MGGTFMGLSEYGPEKTVFGKQEQESQENDKENRDMNRQDTEYPEDVSAELEKMFRSADDEPEPEKTDEDIENEENIEHFQGEIYEEPLTDEQLKALGSENGVFYKIGEVAKMLGVSDQVLRNYCMWFDKFLNIQKTKGGQRLFQKKDVERLRVIIKLKNERRFTNEQVTQFLEGKNPYESNKKHEDGSSNANVLMEMIRGAVVEAVAKALEENMQATTLLLEDQKENYDQIIEQDKNLISTLEKKLAEQNEIITKYAEQQAKTEKLLKDIATTSEENAQVSKELAEKVQIVLEADAKKEEKSSFWDFLRKRT